MVAAFDAVKLFITEQNVALRTCTEKLHFIAGVRMYWDKTFYFFYSCFSSFYLILFRRTCTRALTEHSVKYSSRNGCTLDRSVHFYCTLHCSERYRHCSEIEMSLNTICRLPKLEIVADRHRRRCLWVCIDNSRQK